MASPEPMRLVLATGNAKKLQELRDMLALLAGIQVVSADETGGMPEVDETAPDFAGNALLKALALRDRVPAPAWILADDSGLEVDALGGQPGVRSARFAGEPVSHAANNAELLRRLDGVPLPARTARFRCVLALVDPSRQAHFFTGTCEGHILEQARGTGGFGYDPLFLPAGEQMCFAEMSTGQKNHLSHRGRALAALREFFHTRSPAL